MSDKVRRLIARQVLPCSTPDVERIEYDSVAIPRGITFRAAGLKLRQSIADGEARCEFFMQLDASARGSLTAEEIQELADWIAETWGIVGVRP